MRDKTVTISFRIGEAAFQALQEESKKHNISINTLANQLFTTYAEYDRFLDKFHMIKLSTPTFRRILDAVGNHDAIVDAGKAAGASVPVSFILARKGELSLSNAIDYLKTMGANANLFDYSETFGSGINSITLAHELGPNGSLFLANYVESLMKHVGKEIKILENPDAITVKL